MGDTCKKPTYNEFYIDNFVVHFCMLQKHMDVLFLFLLHQYPHTTKWLYFMSTEIECYFKMQTARYTQHRERETDRQTDRHDYKIADSDAATRLKCVVFVKAKLYVILRRVWKIKYLLKCCRLLLSRLSS